jgi:hypothetical protein
LQTFLFMQSRYASTRLLIGLKRNVIFFISVKSEKYAKCAYFRKI